MLDYLEMFQMVTLVTTQASLVGKQQLLFILYVAAII